MLMAEATADKYWELLAEEAAVCLLMAKVKLGGRLQSSHALLKMNILYASDRIGDTELRQSRTCTEISLLR